MNKYESKLKTDARGAENQKRKFKEIEPHRVLELTDEKIVLAGTDEIFSLVDGSNVFYISNYGRAIQVKDKPELVSGFIEHKRLIYKVPLWINGELEVVDRYADRLVVDSYVENPQEKMYIWHLGDNIEDNYYRNLIPVTWKEHRAIRQYVDAGGFDTEEIVQQVIDELLYKPTVLGVGYWGMPDVDTHHWTYVRWVDMLTRCYSEKHQSKYPNYIGCTVDPEWHNYANFKRWAEENYYEVGGEPVELDKDILKKGNNVYSRENCIFVPKSINSLFVNCRAVRGALPVGVDQIDSSYRARMRYCGKQILIGTYETPEQAFDAYKAYKEKFIADMAERYRGRIPERLYEAITRWEVGIDD